MVGPTLQVYSRSSSRRYSRQKSIYKKLKSSLLIAALAAGIAAATKANEPSNALESRLKNPNHACTGVKDYAAMQFLHDHSREIPLISSENNVPAEFIASALIEKYSSRKKIHDAYEFMFEFPEYLKTTASSLAGSFAQTVKPKAPVSFAGFFVVAPNQATQAKELEQIARDLSRALSDRYSSRDAYLKILESPGEIRKIAKKYYAGQKDSREKVARFMYRLTNFYYGKLGEAFTITRRQQAKIKAGLKDVFGYTSISEYAERLQIEGCIGLPETQVKP